MKTARWSLFFFAALLLSGCAELMVSRILPTDHTPTPQATLAPTATPLPVLNVTQAPAEPVSISVWLPAEFAPDDNNPAGKMLAARLTDFQQRREIRVEQRIKALDGDGGMINGLTTANAAASLALPDVVALPRALLEKAALKGLLYSFDEYSMDLADPDWYPYTHELAAIQGSTYGIPFAGDALVVAYRTKVLGKPPRTWDAVLGFRYPLLFPAGDPDATFLIAQYLAGGSTLQDAEGRPTLDAAALTKVFNFFEQAQGGEQMPYWLTQYETDEQAWQAFLDNRSPLVVTWLSRYLKNPPPDTGIGMLPTATGEDFTLMRGWTWALTSPDPQRRKLAAELIQYMVQKDFTGPWSEAAGYLPPQTGALKTWHDAPLQQLADRMIASSHPAPPSDVLNVVSPVLRDVTVRLLKNQIDSPTAAQEAASKIKPQQ